MLYKLYTDAAFRPSDEKSSGSAIVYFDNKMKSQKFSLQATDNHEAEFITLQKNIEWVLSLHEFNMQKDYLFVYSDSKIVIDSLHKKYAKKYQQNVNKIINQITDLKNIEFELISDKDNKKAHQLAVDALKLKD